MMGHTPVLTEEVIKFLDVEAGGKYIDSTVGGGGHTEAILKKGGEVLGIDQDPTSLELARKRLLSCPGVFKLRLGNFTNLQKIATDANFNNLDGVLFDLGFASFQMDNPERGLSITGNGPLDMRLDPNLAVTAADLLNALPEAELYRLINEVGEEKRARSITRAIVSRRALSPFVNTRDLKDLVEHVSRSSRVFTTRVAKTRLHPATKVFMALRIAVNSELDSLKTALPQAFELLAPGGRIVVISFHSGEDRIVKNIFRTWEEEGKAKILTPKPLTPKDVEILENPRSRSAKLRALQKNENTATKQADETG